MSIHVSTWQSISPLLPALYHEPHYCIRVYTCYFHFSPGENIVLAIFWLINNLENLILYRLGRAMGGGGGGYGLSSNPGDKTYIPLLFRRISSGRIMDFASRHLGRSLGHPPDIRRISLCNRIERHPDCGFCWLARSFRGYCIGFTGCSLTIDLDSKNDRWLDR